MNQLNVAILSGSLHATAFLCIAIGVYLVARRLSPRVGAMTALATLLILIAIIPVSLSGWPRWNFAGALQPTSVIEEEASVVGSVEPSAASSRWQVEERSASMTESVEVSARAESGGTQIFWQTVHRQLALMAGSSSAHPHRSSWLGPVFLMCFVLSVLWRLLGLLAVRRQVTESIPISESTVLESLDVLQAQLSIPGRVDLAESPELTSAATVGWQVPRILLPSNWRSWTETELQVVLAHELAHIARRDYLTWMIAQLGVLLHFYHPLAHWFAGRLRLEQELAADSMAASLVGGRELYLSTLGNLALRTPDGSLAWPAQAFLPVRSTFLRRIEMLRQPKSLFESRWAQGGGPTSVACLVLLGFLVCGLRLPSPVAAQDTQRKTTANALPALDSKFVPDDIGILLQFQPAAIVENPKVRFAVDEMNKLIGVATGGLSLSKMESVWAIGRPPSRPNAGGPSDDFVVLVVRTIEPHAFATKFGSIVPGDGDRAEFIAWDDHTLVFGEGLEAYQASAQQSRPQPTWWKRWNKVKGVTGRAFVGVQPFRSLVDERSPVTAMLGPILHSTRDVLVSFDLDENTNVAARFANADEESAVGVERTIKSLIGFGRNMVEQQRPMINQIPDQQFKAPALATMDLLAELLASAKVKTKGSNVNVKASVEGDGAITAVAAALPAIQAARQAARRTQSINNLRQIALALLNYESAMGHFPAAAMKAEGAEHPHSWRVAILPYLGRNDLYQQYRFEEPWDSPANQKLIPAIPSVLRHPEDSRKGMASYFVPVGENTIFSGDEIGIDKIKDGAANTLMVLEAKRDIPWTKPEDIPEAVKPIDLGWRREFFHAARADGSVTTYASQIDEQAFELLLHKSDGKPLPAALR